MAFHSLFKKKNNTIYTLKTTREGSKEVDSVSFIAVALSH